MKNGNQTYNALVDYINEMDIDPHELMHAVSLLAAQLPNSPVSLIEVFLFADGIELSDSGRKLKRVIGMTDPENSLGNQGMVIQDDPVKVENMNYPDEDWERPVVTMSRTEFDQCYRLDKHNTALMCKFHTHNPPMRSEFDEENVEELIIRVAYSHIEGGFNIRCQKDPPGSSIIQLYGEFTIHTFLPVRIKIIDNPSTFNL